jgi:hypothetical protein
MDATKLNDWLQVVGMVGVIASLLFVGLQLKQSHDIAISNQYQARLDTTISIRGNLLQSDGLIDALRKDASGELLDEVDLFVIYAALGQTFDTWEAAHFQYLNGYLPEEHWQSTLREIPQVLGSLRYAEYWENSRHSYRESFAEIIDPLVPPQRGGPE